MDFQYRRVKPNVFNISRQILEHLYWSIKYSLLLYASPLDSTGAEKRIHCTVFKSIHFYIPIHFQLYLIRIRRTLLNPIK